MSFGASGLLGPWLASQGAPCWASNPGEMQADRHSRFLSSEVRSSVLCRGLFKKPHGCRYHFAVVNRRSSNLPFSGKDCRGQEAARQEGISVHGVRGNSLKPGRLPVHHPASKTCALDSAPVRRDGSELVFIASSQQRAPLFVSQLLFFSGFFLPLFLL